MSESISLFGNKKLSYCRLPRDHAMHIVNLTLNQTNRKPSIMSRLLVRKTEKQIGYSWMFHLVIIVFYTYYTSCSPYLFCISFHNSLRNEHRGTRWRSHSSTGTMRSRDASTLLSIYIPLL